MIIRNLNADDINKVSLAEKECFDDPWSENSFREILNSPYSFCLVGILISELVGYLVSYNLGSEGHLLNVAVRPEFRGRGYGRQLMDYWLEIGKDSGWKSAFLEVRTENSTAIKLYESYGFEQVGIRKKYYPSGEDALLMNLTIAS